MKKYLKFYIFILLLVILTLILVVINNFINIKDNDKKEEINNYYLKVQTPIPEPKELFSSYYSEADEILKDMSLEEKLSQMFIIPFSSYQDNEKYSSVGGFILYSNDIRNISKESIINKINERQSTSHIKYIMTIDEEGGTVSRLNYNRNLTDTKIESPRTLYNEGGIDKVLETEEYKDKLLLELGFNLNLAPVADISVDPNDFMYQRSIGLDPTATGKYISLVTKKAQELKFSTCLKHFPGYGNNGDTHKIQTIDNRSLSYLRENDFIPFKMGIEAGTPFILISHNIVTNIDNEYPASLSSKVINILKNELNYTGLIISDELTMDALDEFNTNNELSTLAINAGNDLLITKDYENSYNSALKSLQEGKINEEQINKSVRKILAWKIAYNII